MKERHPQLAKVLYSRAGMFARELRSSGFAFIGVHSRFPHSCPELTRGFGVREVYLLMDVAMASTFAIEQLVRHIYASLQDPTAPSSINIKY
jgi:hypothetical protein